MRSDQLLNAGQVVDTSGIDITVETPANRSDSLTYPNSTWFIISQSGLSGVRIFELDA